ncbi:MAG: peptidase C39 family protein [Candidatus Poribacteria bacterium]|nr:peptidase C39 family protein [Candidatus Poribacteria bacterium]
MIRLAVPHCQQENATTCLPAAVRMVLMFWGIERDEYDLRESLQWDGLGTSVYNVALLNESDIGVTAETGESDVESLRRTLLAGVPVIVAIKTGSLPGWNVNRPHAIVVIGYDDTHVYFNDPKFPDAPKTASWDNLIAAWETFGRFTAVIRRNDG